MAFNSANFSSRKIQGRRYTDLPNDSQEAFTSTIDIQSSEVLTDDRYIPTGSLPFSGSSQHLNIVSRSFTDPDVSEDGNVLQYHYRHKLTRAFGNDINRETFYFLSDEPVTAATKINSDQLITGSQYTNFINNKNIGADEYATLGAGDAENALGAGLAYNVIVYKSTQSDKNNVTVGDVVDAGDYVFDYKTGILNFTSDNAVNPDGGEYVYMTAYRYVGRTLSSQLTDGTLGGGNVESVPTASVIAVTDEDSSGLEYGIVFAHTGSGVNLFTDAERGTSATRYGLTYTPNTNTLTIGTLANAKVIINENKLYANTGGSGLSFDLFADDSNLQTLNFGNAATTIKIAGDLEVNGTVTSIQTDNLNVSDQFILLASGSSGTKDGGIIVQSGSNGVGTALYFDADANRWAVNPANTVNWDDIALTPKQYVVSVSASAAAPTTDPLDFGTTSEYYGMMHVNTDTGDIYIYS